MYEAPARRSSTFGQVSRTAAAPAKRNYEILQLNATVYHPPGPTTHVLWMVALQDGGASQRRLQVPRFARQLHRASVSYAGLRRSERGDATGSPTDGTVTRCNTARLATSLVRLAGGWRTEMHVDCRNEAMRDTGCRYASVARCHSYSGGCSSLHDHLPRLV
jgi:hypothetical protein